jgi:flavin-dependent dehydrogenase
MPNKQVPNKQIPSKSVQNNKHFEIAVLGGGPAGIVTAIGLAKLGYQVCVISLLRSYNVTEGISERVYQALINLGLEHALQEVGPAIPRSVSWNGSQSAANTERLIQRRAFDSALLNDLTAANIPFYEESILSLSKENDTWKILCKSGKSYSSSFIVEARGRAAPVTKDSHRKGANSLSICQNWKTSMPSLLAPKAMAISLENGWLWLANNGNGNIFTQASVSANSQLAPNKTKLSTFIHELLLSQPELAEITPFIKTDGKAVARSSSPVFNKQPIQERYIAVGDAAMSVDPLSGNGIFQSLSSALIAPVVINTILKKSQNKALAQTFYYQRLHHLFLRFSRIGRDFYKMETRWPNHSFWQERCQWPDQQPAHQDQDRIISVEKRPVINGNFIEEKKVVITAEQPLGIWKINNQDAVIVLDKKLRELNLIAESP